MDQFRSGWAAAKVLIRNDNRKLASLIRRLRQLARSGHGPVGVSAMGVSSTNKRVLLIRFDREPVAGYVNPQTYLLEGRMELLTAAGSIFTAPVTDVKAVCFVRDLPTDEVWISNRYFTVRPKTEGLWLRFRFRDRDGMDGVVPNNLLAIDTEGYMVVPPDPSFLTQRIFVPKQALTEAQVLGVIGSPLNLGKRKPGAGKKSAAPPAQINLFEG